MIVDDASDDDLQALWREYKATGSPEARERLILLYSPFAKEVAAHVAAARPGTPDKPDLPEMVSFGMFGLIDAIQGFNPDPSMNTPVRS